MKWIVVSVRWWLGLWMLYHGLNWWFRFSPQPVGINSQYLHLAFMHSGLFSVAKTAETLMGLALLTNRFVPLLCVVGFPVTFNVAWIHFVLEGPRASGYFVLFAHLFLLVVYAPHYRDMLISQGRPMTSWDDLKHFLRRADR
jgi:hypothetical protein